MHNFDELDCLACLFGSYVQRSTVHDGLVHLVVEQVASSAEGIAFGSNFFNVDRELFATVHGLAGFGVGKRSGDNRTGLQLIGNNVLNGYGTGNAAGDGTEVTHNLEVLGRETVCAVNFNVDDGLAGSGDDELCHIVCVTGGESHIEVRVCNLCLGIPIDEVESDADGVRSGVIYATCAEGLQSLPVPTTAEAGVTQVDLLYVTDLTGSNDLFHLQYGRTVERLVESGDDDVVFFCGLHQIHALVNGLCKRLFVEHVVAVLQAILCDCIVHVREGCVDDEVDILAAEQFGVACVTVATKLFHTSYSTLFDLVNDSNNFDVIIQFGKEVLAVNTATTASLTNNSNFHFLHNTIPPCIHV